MKKLMTILLCALLMTGCGRKETTPTVPTAPAATAAPAETPTVMPTEAPTEAPTDAPTEAPSEALLVYYGDDNAEKILCKEVFVYQIDEPTLIAQLIEVGVLRKGVAVNSIEQNGAALTVDFNQDFADLVCSMGTSGEYIIVGSTVNTFLKAYDASSLLLTVNGEILESGHVIYDFPLEFTQ